LGERGYKSDGRFAINTPGIVCPDCTDDVLDKVPDPPGLLCANELSAKTAGSILLETEFMRDDVDGVHFFIQLFPDSVQIFHAAAVRLHRNGYKKEAYDVLEKGIKNCKNHDELSVEMAAFAGMDGAPALGLKYLERASQQAERFFLVKGNLLRALGKWDEAADCWKKAINNNPAEFFAWNNLGYYLMQVKKQFADAKTHYEKASAAFPRIRRFRAYVGDALYFQGLKQEALKEYHHALEIPDEDEDFEESLQAMINACKEKS